MIKVASQEEINVFLKAAEDRFKELGVPDDTAFRVFSTQLAKLAQNLEIPLVEAPHSPRPAPPEEGLVHSAAMERFFELGIPKEAAEQYMRQMALEQAHALEQAKAAAHSTEKVANFAEKIRGLVKQSQETAPKSLADK